MPAVMPGARPAPALAVEVAISPLTDLSFSLFVVRTPSKHETNKWVAPLREQDPDLFEAIAAFWPEVTPGSACDEWTELLLIAQAHGELFTPDPGAYLRRLRQGVPAMVVPELPTEDAEVRPRLQERIDQLHGDGPFRERYANLLSRVWAFLEPYWLGGAKAETEAMADDLRRRVALARTLSDVVPGAHLAVRDKYRAIVEAALARDEVVLVPVGLNPGGGFLFSFPGLLMVSFGPDIQLFAAERRKSGELAANRFKVLSDPTRMAFVNRMLHGQVSVTDLASYFEVSQPTVSAHVKILRDAGLLEAERAGTFTFYKVTEARLREFIDEAMRDLSWRR